ncbi:MAG TPA: cyclic peptide export ABC transporter, partial [Thermoanaerobaculia bacterium]|nr:cyclic peptide export ABC transporter [Thermoanaerobaculia bacterium]
LYMMTPLDTILNLLPNLGRATVAIRKVESLGLSLQEKTGDADALVVPPAVPSWQRIELSGISHAYRREGEDDSFLLGPVDLGVNAGETLFLVGGNGSGKTTLAKLLMGLYMPEQGEIRLDGKAVTNLDRDSYRQLFSAVFADFYLFETLLGLDRTGLDEQALKYLSDLHLADKVKVKDGTLSTLDLSQGQRKRLALLTAYLEDRPIYLFDEWAADQDPYFKEIFYTQLLRELKTRRKTIVVISHDDRYYHLADRIVKLEYGKVVYDGEFGSYLEIAKDMAEPQTPPAA